MMEDRLRECPFCGGKVEWEYTPWDEETQTGDDGTGWIECTKCHVQVIFGLYRDSDEEKWNTRTTDPLLEKMAEALEELDDMFDPTSRVGEIINKALQEYRERKDDGR